MKRMRNIGLLFIALVLVSTTFSQPADQEAVEVPIPWQDHRLRGLSFAKVSVERVLVPFYTSLKAAKARAVRICDVPGGPCVSRG